MNDLMRPPRLEFDRRPDPIDGLLSRFFRSEMPDPWPAPPSVPSPRENATPRRKPRRRFLQSSRFALAAAVTFSVTFFLVGYLALSGLFPRGNSRSVPPIEPKSARDHIPGKQPLHKLPTVVPGKGELKQQGFVPLPTEIVPLRNGGQAEMTGHRTPGPRPTIYLHLKMQRP
jgi:hypothetical protein